MRGPQNGPARSRQAFLLGAWLVEPMLDQISRDGRVVRLRPRAMDVLTCLAAAAGKLASKRDLIDAVWRTEHVSDHALTQVIAELRAALEDDARNPMYIENVPRRGYRLVTAVTPVAESVPPAREAAVPFRLQGEGGDHPLKQGANLIGRTADADICIDRTAVSRAHARIVVTGTTATIEDLGSKNGTYLNGARLEQPAVLTNGDDIWIGRSVARLRFLVEGEPTLTEHSEL
jgi:DNA-binding winged helix-turn-helix (wHTH) protein